MSIAAAQTGSDDPAGLRVSLGQTSTVQTAVLTFTTATTAGTPFTVGVLTQGSPNLDFNFVSGGTCSAAGSYSIGQTCTVRYTFSPRFPGTRYGGITLAVGATVLANTYIGGTGLGPQAAFVPANSVTLGGNLSFPSTTFALDGAGNIYTVQNGFNPALIEIPKGCQSATCTVTLTNFSDFFTGGVNTGPDPGAIVIDGSGNFYVTGMEPYVPVLEFPRGCLQKNCSIPLGYGISNIPGTLAVDESGKSGATVYTSGSYLGTTYTQTHFYVMEIPPDCAAVSCEIPISQAFGSQIDYMRIDAAGNIFFGGTGPVSDPFSGGTYEIPAGCKSASCNVTFSGVGGGGSVSASDEAGNLFVTGFSGYMPGPYTWEFPAGCFDVSCVGLVSANTYGWYLPRVQFFNGNVYGMNSGGYAVNEYDLTDPATLTFPATIQDQVSPTQTVSLTNEGNEPLIFAIPGAGINASVSQYFNLSTSSSSSCPSLTPNSFSTASLVANASCDYPLSFAPAPPALGTINGTVILTDNNLNVAGASQTIPLVGTAVAPMATAALAASPTSVTYGTTVGFTCFVNSNTPTIVPTGTITFLDNGTPFTSVTIGSGGASISTTALPPGIDQVSCIYSGDSSYASVTSNAVLVTVMDFSIAATPPMRTINPGDAATYTITLAGIGTAYTLPVTLAASGLPTGATMSFGQSTLTPGAGPTTTTMTVTTAPYLASNGEGSGVVLAVLALPLLGMIRRRRALLCVVLLMGLGALNGCGGGYFGPPPQSFVITLTGVSGSLSHAATVTLKVQ